MRKWIFISCLVVPMLGFAADSTVPISSNPMSPTKDYSTRFQEMQQQFDAFNAANIQFQEQTNARLQKIEQQNLILQQQMLTLIQNLTVQSQAHLQQIQSLHSNPSMLTRLGNTLVPYLQQVENIVGETGVNIIMGGLVLLLLVLLWMLRPKRKTVIKTASPRDKPELKIPKDGDEEYDYMGSKESIPAKFDLARAYLDMEDSSSAREVLETILQEGNLEQQKQARAMLDNL